MIGGGGGVLTAKASVYIGNNLKVSILGMVSAIFSKKFVGTSPSELSVFLTFVQPLPMSLIGSTSSSSSMFTSSVDDAVKLYKHLDFLGEYGGGGGTAFTSDMIICS